MITQVTENDFFQSSADAESDALRRRIFDVGHNGAEITGATPNHTSASSGPDNGAIAGLRRIRNAQRTHGKSDDVGGMFDWISAAQPRFIHLLGHGSSGLFDVGDGQSAITTAGCLHSINVHYWRDHMGRLSKYDENRRVKAPADDVLYSGGLMLEGCCVAEGVAGARLMKLVADATLRTVFAYTGLISVRNNTSVWFEKGHAWMRQDPLSSEPTVEVRQLHESLIRTANLELSGLGKEMETDDVVAIEVTNILTAQSTMLKSEAAKQLLAQLFYSKGFKPEGNVLGIITHRLRVLYRNQTELNVEVRAMRLAQTSAGIAFIVGPNFADLLAKFEGLEGDGSTSVVFTD